MPGRVKLQFRRRDGTTFRDRVDLVHGDQLPPFWTFVECDPGVGGEVIRQRDSALTPETGVYATRQYRLIKLQSPTSGRTWYEYQEV